jgi:lysophospholipid acyltransferase (LPLAT)-like uncharacterized protein
LAIYGNAGAATLHGFLVGLARTCRVRVENEAALAGPARVFAYWHADALLGFVFLLQRLRHVRFAALCHPAPSLRPWEVLGRRLGWEVALGSSGHGGKAAAERVAAWLREGRSTFVCPDGPAGPPRVLKRGAVVMALESGRPLVPLRFACEREVELPRWDRLRVPAPGSAVTVTCGDPIAPEGDGAEAESALARALGALTR